MFSVGEANIVAHNFWQASVNFVTSQRAAYHRNGLGYTFQKRIDICFAFQTITIIHKSDISSLLYLFQDWLKWLHCRCVHSDVLLLNKSLGQLEAGSTLFDLQWVALWVCAHYTSMSVYSSSAGCAATLFPPWQSHWHPPLHKQSIKTTTKLPLSSRTGASAPPLSLPSTQSSLSSPSGISSISLWERSLWCGSSGLGPARGRFWFVCLFVFHAVTQHRGDGGILRCRLRPTSCSCTTVGVGGWYLLFVSTGCLCNVFIDPSHWHQRRDIQNFSQHATGQGGFK